MRDLLVTAGATRNPVDAIRYLSANATGQTGVALAARLSTSHRPHLLGSVEACLRAPQGLSTETYGSTRDLYARVERWSRAHPGAAIVHSAAVGDYEVPPEELATPRKIASGAPELVLRLVPTVKILDHIRGWCPDAFLVSFKAAAPGKTPEELEAIARAQLRRTSSDLVFANVLGALRTSVLLVDARTTRAFADRDAAVEALARRVEARA